MENRAAASVLDIIGRTPLVELRRIARGLDGRIFAKVEFFNPGYSKKDRIACKSSQTPKPKGICSLATR